MSIEISCEAEARLNDEARKRGISVDALLEQLIIELGATNHSPADVSNPELPVWHLGTTGAFHRRDIYDDVH